MSAAPEFAQPASLPPTSEDYHALTIRSVHWWSPTLFSLVLDRPESFRFISGQFARLGLPVEGEWVWRAYSICSSVFDEHLEFLSIVVPNGPFTQALKHVQAGDTLYVDKRNFGTLTTDRFRGQKDLWMLATGTGIAPFLSMLREPGLRRAWKRIVVVHSVRVAAELAPAAPIAALASEPGDGAAGARVLYLPVVTRERGATVLSARIPSMLGDGTLEDAAGAPIDVARSRVLTCGNPAMARDVRRLLAARGFAPVRRNAPGQMVFENYWQDRAGGAPGPAPQGELPR